MDWLELKDRLGSDRLAEDADLHCSVNCVGVHWRVLPAVVADLDQQRFVGRVLNLLHVPLSHEASQEHHTPMADG